MTTAAEYAAIIAEEIRALETALDGPNDSYDPENPSEDDERDADYRAALDVLEYAHDIDRDEILFDYLNGTVLEVVTWRGSNDATRTEWLRTYGGPTCRIYFESDHSDAEIVSTGDDNNVARNYVYCPTLAEQVNELAEMARS